MFEAIARPASPSYQSDKLPIVLVSAAKESAQTSSRSYSGRIEHWEALGKKVELQGLTSQQAKTAIEKSDREIQLQSLISKIKTGSQNVLSRPPFNTSSQKIVKKQLP